MENKIAFVVPTKDREKDLRLMLSSLVCQTRIPDQIIVVDGSDPEIKFVINEFNELPIDYIREFPPSLSKQRNAGIEKLHSDITLAGYLDDDIVLESDAVENMLAFWDEADTGYGGAAFCITNAKSPAGTGIKQLFFLDYFAAGKLDVDVFEEVLRIYGYNKISTSHQISFPSDVNQNSYQLYDIKNKIFGLLSSVGFFEIKTNSLVSS